MYFTSCCPRVLLLISRRLSANCNPSQSLKELMGTSPASSLLLTPIVKPNCWYLLGRILSTHLVSQLLRLPPEEWAAKSPSSDSQHSLPLPSPSSPLQITSISLEGTYLAPQLLQMPAKGWTPRSPGSKSQQGLHSQIPQDYSNQ